MDKNIIKLLKLIENQDYRAYVVGGYVRDYLLGRISYDIDIATDMPLNKLKNIFSDYKLFESFGALKLKIKNYNISITVFRDEISYKNNKPDKLEYTASLETDAQRRDFTINAMYMDQTMNIIDPLKAMNELNNKTIKVIGDIDKRLLEDNTRILRALRFMSVLDFKLDCELFEFIIKNKHLIKNINYNKKKEELDKIFNNKNFQIFLTFIKNNNLNEYFEIDYKKVKYSSNYLGVWAQIDFSKKYNFSKTELLTINSIKELLKKDNISNMDLFNYGKDISLIGAEVLEIEKEDLIKRYKSLAIKSEKDLNITYKQIENLGVFKEVSGIKDAIHTLTQKVVEGVLKNDYNELRDFIRGYYG